MGCSMGDLRFHPGAAIGFLRYFRASVSEQGSWIEKEAG